MNSQCRRYGVLARSDSLVIHDGQLADNGVGIGLSGYDQLIVLYVVLIELMLDTGVLFKARLLSVKQITWEHPQLTRNRGEVALTPTNCRLEFSALKSTRTQRPICSTELHSIITKTSKSNRLLGLPVLSLCKTVRSLNNFFTETTSCCKVCPSLYSPFFGSTCHCAAQRF